MQVAQALSAAAAASKLNSEEALSTGMKHAERLELVTLEVQSVNGKIPAVSVRFVPVVDLVTFHSVERLIV